MRRRPALRALAAACFCVAVLAVLTGTGRPASAASEAGEFLSSMTGRAIAQLTDESLALSERKARFRILFRENFDVPAVGRFVLGRYWRKSKPETREAFLSVFEEVMIQRFAPKFAGYAETKFEVSRVRALEQAGHFVIRSRISPDRGEAIEIDWRVQERDGNYKILDVIGEGISMALTLRSEYVSSIKNAGGQVEALIDRLRAQVESEGDTQTSKSVTD
ncbi:MAG: MlaC/ttg2D family ABC transporter substrate-binding protein [Alphaproteobacteria bacterium]